MVMNLKLGLCLPLPLPSLTKKVGNAQEVLNRAVSVMVLGPWPIVFAFGQFNSGLSNN